MLAANSGWPGGKVGLVPEIEQRDFVAQQQGGADFRRGDGGWGHGRRVWLNMVVRLALLPLPVQLTSLRGRRALVYWYRACFEEVPMRNLAITILTVGIALAAAQARAQTYDPAVPVCMNVVAARGGTYYDCSYYTMGQCQASAAGRGAMCSPNPYYAGPPLASRPSGRRYRQAGAIPAAQAGAVRAATACRGANGAIPAIANSPATPNAWPPQAVPTPIAGSIRKPRMRASGVAPIRADTEQQ